MKFKDKKVLEVDLKDYPKIKINNKIFEVKEGEWPYIDEDRYYNKNGFYIEKEREDDFEVIWLE